MRCFETPEERAAVAEEIMEYGQVESELTRRGEDGRNEAVVQKVLYWRVRELGALCVLRSYTHRNVMVDGDQLTVPNPFFYMYFTYARPHGGKATAYIDLDPHFSNLKNSS